MAKVLNNFFMSVFSKNDPIVPPKVDKLPSASVLSNVVFDAYKVKKKIEKLRPGSAPGPDGITTTFLKQNAAAVAPALAAIYNKSMQEGTVPEDWRGANVTPIFKKGAKGNPGNYRPVSLTSIPCKIMESCIRDEVVNHLVVNNLIKGSQHGFMKHKSCTTNLLEFLEKLTAEQDQGGAMDVIYLDFSKAFDKVPHQRLLDKFVAHSVDGNVLNWVRGWLSGRVQRTVLNGESSDWGEVGSGVPQGSVLGPLAFIIFINDIDDLTQFISIMNKFADDTKLGHKVITQSDCEVLQKCLDDLVSWAETWGMEFNVKKCKVMHLGRNNPRAQYFMNGVALDTTEEERDIGVKVHQSLRPSKQCSDASRRANVVLGQITRAFHYRNKHTFLDLYKQYVRPHLEFAVPAWSPWTLGDIEMLEKVQRRALRMVSGLTSTSYEDRLKEVGLLSLQDRRLQYDLVQTFKIIRGFDNVDYRTWFTLVGPSPARVTRDTSDPLNIIRQNPRTEIRRQFFSQRVISHWNGLDTAIKNSPSVFAFKAQVNKVLLNK